MGLGKTALFYRSNPSSYRKKLAKANKHPVWGEQTAKRKKKKDEARKKRAEAKKNGKDIKGKHYDHLTDSWMSEKENTGQAEKSRLKGSKRDKGTFGKAIKGVLS